MTIRTTTRVVTFAKPFNLYGVEGALPAGDYTVATDEESIDSLSFVAWRRIQTTIRIVRGGVTEMWPVDATDLDEALNRDGEA